MKEIGVFLFLLAAVATSALAGGLPGETERDLVGQDSLYWKLNSADGYLFSSTKAAAPVLGPRSTMQFRSSSSVPCMAPYGDYVYEVYNRHLYRYRTDSARVDSFPLNRNCGTACGTDGWYIYVPYNDMVDKYTLTGQYLSTTDLDLNVDDGTFAVANNLVWVLVSPTSDTVFRGYLCSRFNGGVISGYDSLFGVGNHTYAPSNIAFDGQQYFVCWYRMNDSRFRRYTRTRVLIDTSVITGRSVRSVMCPENHDVSVTGAVAPVGLLDSGTVVTPACTVYNPGYFAENCTLQLKLGPGYDVKVGVNALAAGGRRYVTFPAWNALPRGNLACTLWARLPTDVRPANDRAVWSIFVTVHDVGVSAIKSPVGAVDSGSTVTPSCSLYNFGNSSEAGYTVRMKIGTGYDRTVTVNSHGQSARILVTFPTWPAAVRGTFAVSCSTRLATDLNRGNDRKLGSVTVVTHDVGVTAIIQPSELLDSGTTVAPEARVRNYGTSTETFLVRLRIGDNYLRDQPLTLPGLSELPMTFPTWVADQRGTYPLTCSTRLTGDQNPDNDRCEQTLLVRVLDVEAAIIVAPVGRVDSGRAVTPQVRVRNLGNTPVVLPVRFRIGTEYEAAELIENLNPGDSIVMQFAPWTAQSRGNIPLQCSTELSGDMVGGNNRRSGSVLVDVHDVAVTAIVSPQGMVPFGTLTPQVTLVNRGTARAALNAVLTINAVPPWVDTVALPAGLPFTDTLVNFPPWFAVTGDYAARCSLCLPGDQVSANNFAAVDFSVGSADTGWVSRADVPAGRKNKNVKDGGCLAATQDNRDRATRVYALKGNNTPEFYAYNVADNTWATRESLPLVGRAGKKKAVKKGACLTAAEGRVYAAKGNGTLEFWGYDPTGDAFPWTQLTDIPVGTRAVKEGAGVVFVNRGTADYVYLLKGSSTQEFYRYDVAASTWEAVADAPLGVSGKSWKNGSCIATVTGNHPVVGALKGSFNEFYLYSVDSNRWSTGIPLPLAGSSGRKKKVKDGAGLAWRDGSFYALKGGNTREAWRFDLASGMWTQMPDVPLGTGRNVKGGGALVATSSALYALKGNNTLEFHRYGFPAEQTHGASIAPQTRGEAADCSPLTTIRVSPNPAVFRNPHSAFRIDYSLSRAGNIRLRLYDLNGRLKATLDEGYRHAGVHVIGVHQRPSAVVLGPGVFIVRLETGTGTATARLIIE